MLLDQAIKAIKDETNNIPVIPHSRLYSAHLLSIEALKFVKADRIKYPYVKIPLLPGETEEVKE